MAETEAMAKSTAVARALERSQIYRALAVVFRYPVAASVDGLKRLAEDMRASAAGHSSASLVEALSELEAAGRGATLESLQDRYVAAFGHVTLPDCPLYETACGIGDPFQQAQTLADIAGFYRAFGLEMAADAAERADHLAVELEFMHYLAYREAFALDRHGPEQSAIIQDAERRFVELHLGRWVPVAARTVAARGDGVLGAAARLLECFVAEEVDRWDLAPPPVAVEGEPLMVRPVTREWLAEGDDDLTETEL